MLQVIQIVLKVWLVPIALEMSALLAQNILDATEICAFINQALNAAQFNDSKLENCIADFKQF